MKPIYAIYCTIKLIDQPGWVDSFRAKYDAPYDFHITLKQMAYIDESVLPKIQSILEGILKDLSPSQQKLCIVFDEIVIDEQDPDDKSGYIYVFAKQRNLTLDQLQEKIRVRLKDHSDYYFSESYQYEHNFRPHITIARSLDPKTLMQARKELPSNVKFIGEVTSIVLSCIKELGLEEANNRKNLTVYEL